jgi:hypothetical protein
MHGTRQLLAGWRCDGGQRANAQGRNSTLFHALSALSGRRNRQMVELVIEFDAERLARFRRAPMERRQGEIQLGYIN